MQASTDTATHDAEPQRNLGAILAVYLLGLLLGGLYVGMASPARTVVQEGFGIDDATGIWMVNVYTLFYAALIPIMGKLADRRGRKRVYTMCVAIFALGSVISGLSQPLGSFGVLLAGRVLEASGAAGMIPVANAEIGTTFPEEKRGAALGLAAAVAGIANVLGTSVGSLVLGITGVEHWSVMYFIALPVCAAILAGAIVFLPRRDQQPGAPMDVVGAVLFVLFVLALLLGIKNIDFTDLTAFPATPLAWGSLLAALALGAAFLAVEKRAADPVFHLEYFGRRPVAVTMAISFFIGCCIISMVMVPEFAEFAMGAKTGSGGYYMMVIGIFAIAGPPLGGRLIDRFGPKPVLAFGLTVMTMGFAFLALVCAPHPTLAGLVGGLAVVGLGMGFAMGAPTNYMVLQSTSPDEASSAVASIALVRQLGTSIGPAILVGFSAQGTLASYQQMLLCVAAFGVAALACLTFYHQPQQA